MLQTLTGASEAIGWTVVPEFPIGFSTNPSVTSGQQWKWEASAAYGGAWGYAPSQERAVERAREEFARLTGLEG